MTGKLSGQLFLQHAMQLAAALLARDIDLIQVIAACGKQLAQLRAKGYYLAIATCKPEYQALPICEHFHVDQMVDGIYGASRDNSRIDKDQVIRYCFDLIGFDAEAGDRAVMVGDRWTDIDGARACGIDTIGCRWGYAEPGEMEEHGAAVIIDSVDQLTDAVDQYFASSTALN